MGEEKNNLEAPAAVIGMDEVVMPKIPKLNIAKKKIEHAYECMSALNRPINTEERERTNVEGR